MTTQTKLTPVAFADELMQALKDLDPLRVGAQYITVKGVTVLVAAGTYRWEQDQIRGVQVKPSDYSVRRYVRQVNYTKGFSVEKVAGKVRQLVGRVAEEAVAQKQQAAAMRERADWLMTESAPVRKAVEAYRREGRWATVSPQVGVAANGARQARFDLTLSGLTDLDVQAVLFVLGGKGRDDAADTV